MKDEKLYTEGISVEQGKFSKWFDNYWYHYKWHTIGILFALIVLLVCTVQSCSQEKEDISLLYAGRRGLTLDESEILCDVLEAVMPDDFDGNGEKSVVLTQYDILSEEQIKEIEASTDSEGVHGYVNRSYNQSEYENYYSYIQTGESSVLLVDEWLFDALRDQGRLMPMDLVLANTPTGALDAYGVRLGDTSWYQTYIAAQILPEDTVICLLRPLVAGKSSKETLYQREKEMFSALTETVLLAE